MSTETPCRLERAGDGQVLHLTGDWRLPHLARLDGALAALPRLGPAVTVDGQALAELDTAAALLLALSLRDAGLDRGPVHRRGDHAQRRARPPARRARAVAGGGGRQRAAARGVMAGGRLQ